MDVTGYKPMKHIRMMNLTEIKRVVDIVDEEATGRFALVCRSNEVSVQTSFQSSRSGGLFQKKIYFRREVLATFKLRNNCTNVTNTFGQAWTSNHQIIITAFPPDER